MLGRFPKARLFVVDDETIYVAKNGTASIKVPSLITENKDKKNEKKISKKWRGTVVDIAADLLQLELGDYIFLWQVKGDNHPSQIFGVYRTISMPYFKMENANDEFPFKVGIELAYDFKNPVDEYDVLNSPLAKGAMTVWTIWGKKIAQKSRGAVPLTFEGIQYLITLLMWKNNGSFRYQPWDNNRIVSIENPLRIDAYKKDDRSKQLVIKPKESLWNQINPNDLGWRDSQGRLTYEKVWEALFNQKIVQRDSEFLDQFGIHTNKIVWFANYLPYSLEKKEMDYLIMESEDGFNISRYLVVEFKCGRIDKDHIERSFLYCNWLDDTYGFGNSVVEPILIYEDPLNMENPSSDEQGCIELIKSLEKKHRKKLSLFSCKIQSSHISINPMIIPA